MWELWVQQTDFDFYCVYASDSLIQIRAVEYEHALHGLITEVRLNMGAIK